MSYFFFDLKFFPFFFNLDLSVVFELMGVEGTANVDTHVAYIIT